MTDPVTSRTVTEEKQDEKEVEAMTKRARKKFRQLDADGNGTLEGDEASTSTHA